MTVNLGKDAFSRPGILSILVALLCFLQPQALAGQTAVDRNQAQAVASYVVQPGDVLSLTIWGYPSPADKLEGRFPVEANGRVYLPVVGQVDVAGKTTERVQAEVRQRIAAEQSQAVISIEPFFVVGVNGEVHLPNVYDFRPGQTVFDAVVRAGGYTLEADRKKLLLVRDGQPQTVEADDANELATQLAQMPLRSGDRLLIHPRKRLTAGTVLNVLQAAVAAATLYALLTNN
jgi:polysaccharide biosynthesis/export protein